MASTVAQMTKKEFTQILSTVVEQKLVELFGDSDEGFSLKESVRERLLKQKKAVSKAERGEDFEIAVKKLGFGRPPLQER